MMYRKKSPRRAWPLLTTVGLMTFILPGGGCGGSSGVESAQNSAFSSRTYRSTFALGPQTGSLVVTTSNSTTATGSLALSNSGAGGAEGRAVVGLVPLIGTFDPRTGSFKLDVNSEIISGNPEPAAVMGDTFPVRPSIVENFITVTGILPTGNRGGNLTTVYEGQPYTATFNP